MRLPKNNSTKKAFWIKQTQVLFKNYLTLYHKNRLFAFVLFVWWTTYHFRLMAGVQKQHIIIAMTTTLNKFLFSGCSLLFHLQR